MKSWIEVGINLLLDGEKNQEKLDPLIDALLNGLARAMRSIKSGCFDISRVACLSFRLVSLHLMSCIKPAWHDASCYTSLLYRFFGPHL